MTTMPSIVQKRLAKTVVLPHVRLDVGHVLVILQEAAVVVAVLPALLLALEIVVAGRAFLVAVGAPAVLDHLADLQGFF